MNEREIIIKLARFPVLPVTFTQCIKVGRGYVTLMTVCISLEFYQFFVTSRRKLLHVPTYFMVRAFNIGISFIENSVLG